MLGMSRRNVGVLVVACVGAFIFYWYDYRPQQIRIECEETSTVAARQMMEQRADMHEGLDIIQSITYKEYAKNGFYLVADKDGAYKDCLRGHGLESSSDSRR
jgi:hypothetical protein